MLPIYFDKKRKAPTIILGYTTIAIVAISPILVAIFAGWVAESNGCTLDEGSVHPCIIAGTDMGDILYAMGVMGWFSLLSMPLGFAGLILWTIKVRESLHYSRNCMRFTLSDYSVLYTGDRMFLETHVNQKDTNSSLLRVFFLNQKEEQKIKKDVGITVEGLIQRDSFNQALLVNTRVIKNNQQNI